MPPLTPSETKQLIYGVMTDCPEAPLRGGPGAGLLLRPEGTGAFPRQLLQPARRVAAVFRVIPWEIKSFEELHLPPIVAKLCDRPRGLILVTGPTGSGKSTTLAAMIDKINRERHEHILTIEDPIEFVHPHKNCLVNQREVHSDTKSFGSALRAALREDPDVVLVGEMRDLETVESALRIAETGHLTLGTLHTNSASSTINRIIDVFPSHQQPQIRAQLSLVLEGILCQSLLPRLGGNGTRHGHGDPDPQCRHPQPDPRRQDPPDLFRHAVRAGQVRHADPQPVSGDPVFAEADFLRGGPAALLADRRAAGHHPACPGLGQARGRRNGQPSLNAVAPARSFGEPG